MEKVVVYSVNESQNIGGGIVFGIDIIEEEPEGNRKLLRRIEDISENRSVIERLVEQMNTEYLECVHFDDIIENFLVSFT